MKYPKSLALMSLLLVLLTAAATSPKAAYRAVVQAPAVWLNKVSSDLQRQRSIEQWGATTELAYVGDIDAMVAVALKMRSASWWEEFTGIPVDSLSSESILRHAAAMGNHLAKWVIWGIDGEDPDELMALYNWSMEKRDFSYSGMLHGYLHWYGVKLCRQDMRDASRVIHEHVKAQYGTSVHTQQDRFEVEYREACEVH